MTIAAEFLRAALVDRTHALAELVRETDPATPIPTCPGWTLSDLVTHVGRAQRWAAAMIAARSATELDIRAVPDGARPAPGAAAGWLEAGPARVLDAIDAAGAETEVWITLGAPRPARWWLRRLAHEATVHGADALLAVHRPAEIEPELAADAIEEWLELLAAGLGNRGEAVLPDGASLHLHATDHERGEWAIRPVGSSITWEHTHIRATVAVRAPAAQLLLAMLGRIPPSAPEVYGEAALLERWLRRTRF
ncbi:maleylpyruvate isomerase family mycothiol-dependent enzyme [Nocardia sp. NPDC050697]|uniref:maleylpyruvate isomerase family mycothiol-dependent enzyme n=1 Tax=Nocardia sp. NPDC050697 TaxID=3155158 RepID=UPI0033D50205